MSAPRAVVDTNVLVSALINPAGAPAAVVAAIRDLRLVPVVSADILAEYDEVLRRPRLNLPPAEIEELLVDLRGLALLVQIPAPSATASLPDPDDWPFIAAARTAGCPVITGNARHFPAQSGVEAVGPGEFLARLTVDIPPES